MSASRPTELARAALQSPRVVQYTVCVLFCSPRRRAALNVPIMLGTISAICLLSALSSFYLEVGWGPVLLLVFALLLTALSLGQLRWMGVEENQLVMRTIYGSKKASLQELALGMSRHVGHRGGRTFTVVAIQGEKEFDLAEAGTENGGERLRQRIEQTFLGGRLPHPSQRDNERRAREKEEIWKRQDEQARALVEQYYGKGGMRRTIYMAIAILVFVLLGGALATYISLS